MDGAWWVTLEDGTQVRQFDNEQEFIDYLETVYEHEMSYSLKHIPVGYEGAEEAFICDEDFPAFATVKQIRGPNVQPISLNEEDTRYAIINGVIWYKITEYELNYEPVLEAYDLIILNT